MKLKNKTNMLIPETGQIPFPQFSDIGIFN